MNQDTLLDYATSSPADDSVFEQHEYTVNNFHSSRSLQALNSRRKRSIDTTSFPFLQTRISAPLLKKRREKTPSLAPQASNGDGRNIAMHSQQSSVLRGEIVELKMPDLAASMLNKAAEQYVKKATIQGDSPRYKCIECPHAREYKRRFNCVEHVTEHHFGVKNFQCARCDFSHNRRYVVVRHEKTCKARNN